MLLKLFVFISFYELGMLLFQFKLMRMLLGILGYIGAEFYLIILNRNEIIRGEPIAELSLMSADAIPNTLLIDSNQSLYAVTGILFFSTVETEDYLDRLRFQDQFSIIHIESQQGSVYLVIYELLMAQPWTKLGEEQQSYYLKQTCKHLENFQGVLHELIPGFKMRLLSIAEVSEECGLTNTFHKYPTLSPEIPKQCRNKKQSETSESTFSYTKSPSLKKNLLHKLNIK